MADKKRTVFQQALLDSLLMEYADIPPNDQLEDTFSPRFHAWAEDFLRQQSPKRVRRRRIIRTVLIAALLAALLAGTAMAIPAVRNAIIDHLFHDREEWIGISFDPEVAATAPDGIETVYTFSHVPEGFDLILEAPSTIDTTLLWMDSNGILLTYSQNVMPDDPTDDSWLGLNNKNNTKETVLLGDYLVDVIRTDENYKLVWTNNAYFFVLELPNAIQWETATEMFLSWTPAP